MSGLCPLQEQTQSDLIAAAAPLRPGPEVEVSLTAVDRRVDSMLRSDRLERKPGRARIVDVSHCRGTMSTLPLPATTCGRSGSVPLQRRGGRARLRRPCVLKRLLLGDWPEYRPCGAKVMSSAAAETAAEHQQNFLCEGLSVVTARPGSCQIQAGSGSESPQGQGSLCAVCGSTTAPMHTDVMFIFLAGHRAQALLRRRHRNSDVNGRFPCVATQNLEDLFCRHAIFAGDFGFNHRRHKL